MRHIYSGRRLMLVGALCLGASTAAMAQSAQDAQERAATAVKRVDGNFIRANAAQKKTPDPTARAT
ncbi:hypothetical protein ET532_021470 [Verminephrobacter sp. Larva24]|nr:hypothetical protein ET532_021470 [Verminephrobacter sp. Larva24]